MASPRSPSSSVAHHRSRGGGVRHTRRYQSLRLPVAESATKNNNIVNIYVREKWTVAQCTILMASISPLFSVNSRPSFFSRQISLRPLISLFLLLFQETQKKGNVANRAKMSSPPTPPLFCAPKHSGKARSGPPPPSALLLVKLKGLPPPFHSKKRRK